MATILIASAEHLEALKRLEHFRDAQTFVDTEVVRALEVIIEQRPEVVALERMFAATSRGAALVDRIKAQVSLSSCDIRIVAHDADDMTVASEHHDRPADYPAAAIAPAAATLDWQGTRRTPRFPIVDGVDVIVDGNTAALINLSLTGAQVVSPTVLRPNQRVRMAFTESGHPIRFSARVAWASFEPARTGPRYRAGIEFVDQKADAIQRFCDAKKKN